MGQGGLGPGESQASGTHPRIPGDGSLYHGSLGAPGPFPGDPAELVLLSFPEPFVDGGLLQPPTLVTQAANKTPELQSGRHRTTHSRVPRMPRLLA